MKSKSLRKNRSVVLTLAFLSALSLIAAACSSGGSGSASSGSGSDGSGGGSEGGGDKTINVAIVENGQMKDIEALTPELFTEDSGISVNYTVLSEEELRSITTRAVAAGDEQFDVVMIGAYEAPQFGENGFIADLTEMANEDEAYDVDDILPAVKSALSKDGRMYASPFYAESSFMMYRQDILDEAGLEMPESPTWEEVASIAREIHTDETAGICLRGKPGWGNLGASFTTVLNTFGGTWWSANGDGGIDEAKITDPEFKEALEFYVDLVQDAGEPDAANSNFGECLNLYKEGKVAMWYDATVAAGLLEGDDSDVKGKNGYALAPTNKTDASGWLWAWSLAIPESNEDKATAWEYISWATGKEYLKEAGDKVPGGWASIPPGTRKSTYEIPEYVEAAKAFAPLTLKAMEAAPVDNPGTTPRPGNPGVQYVGVPEFQDVGDRCSQELSAVIAGGTSIDDAIANCQTIAEEATS